MRWYSRSIWVLHKRLVYVSLKRICERVGPSTACKLINANQVLTGRTTRFRFDKEQGLYTADENGKVVYFVERMRGIWLYSHGIGSRGTSIFKSYFLDSIDFSPADVVIDCGANYGDLYIHLSQLVSDIRYVTFEPSPKEHECVLRNAPGQEHYASALAKVSGPIELFVSSKGADSSIIEPHSGYTHKLTVDGVCLNEFAETMPAIKLLKLEAEGAEPEILEGALDVLEKIEYIAADGGAERGLSRESTIESITNVLLEKNFELVRLDVDSGKGRALFRNKRFH